MSNTIRKIIAVVCGVLLLVGIACCIYIKDDELIGSVVLFGVLYAVYLFVLSKRLKTNAANDKKSPLRRR